MTIPVTVWTKPDCQQCRMVKHRLEIAGVEFEERDLTAPEYAKDLRHFIGIGYRSVPITEFKHLAVPGFVPAEIDRVIDAWRADRAGAPLLSPAERAEADRFGIHDEDRQ